MTLLGSEQAGIGSIPTAAGPDSPGINPPAAIPTLAAVYLAGAGNVQADDVFAEPSGNLRFIGDAGTGGVPGTAWYESSATPGDSRFAAWYTRRYLRVGTGVGQTIGDALVGFDPLWDGTFGQLNGTKLTVARAGYTASTDETSAAPTLLLADASFQALSGFFNGPVCFPTPGFNSGSVETFVLDLWNGGTTDTRGAFTFSGWGQTIQRPLPLSNGVTAAIDFRPDWSKITPAANDGIGIMWRRADDDPPCAMVDAHMLAANAAGDYGLGFWARSGGTLSEIATFDWTNGIVFNAPVTFNSSNGLGILTVVETSDVDLLTPGTYPIVPANISKRFIPTGFVVALLTQLTGTATAAGNITIGSNATHDNFLSAAAGTGNLSTAWLNGGVGNLRYTSLAVTGNIPTVTTTNADFSIVIAASPTGLTVAEAKFLIMGYMVP